MSIAVKELNKDLIHRANSNSFGGKRGDISEHEYQVYVERVLSWPISDEKKQSILDKLHEKWSEMLKYEAQHVSVMVAGQQNTIPGSWISQIKSWSFPQLFRSGSKTWRIR